MTDSHILRPLPQRTWQLTPSSTSPPTPSSPSDPQNDEKLASQSPPSRSRSILNLTSSTLFGIYQSGTESVQGSIPGTPWGTGAMTPMHSPTAPVFGEERRYSGYERKTELPTRKAFRKQRPVDFFARTILLFAAGLAYGALLSRIQDNPHISPLKVEGVNRNSWNYLISWGLTGAVAGNLIPWIEMTFEEEEQEAYAKQTNGKVVEKVEQKPEQINFSSDWSQPLRGIGVFIGIAYAIKKLPWESSSQAALTLALANPGLWFLVDRSRMGLIMSTVFAVAGTFVLLAINPDLIPQPSGGVDGYLTAFERIQAHGLFSSETVGVFTWIASVVFCSCVCFRSLGKRLVGLQEQA